MSDDFDGLFEGAAELIGTLVEMVTFNSMLPDGDTVSTATAMSASRATKPDADKPVPFLEGFEEGAKYRVLENDWWADVTTADVLVVKSSDKSQVIFNRPSGPAFTVPIGMIDDFERIENGASR